VTKIEKTCHNIGNNVTTFQLVNFSGKSPSYFRSGEDTVIPLVFSDYRDVALRFNDDRAGN